MILDPSICITADPCVNGKCQLTASGHKCLCYPGYTGQNCDQGMIIVYIVLKLFNCNNANIYISAYYFLN